MSKNFLFIGLGVVLVIGGVFFMMKSGDKRETEVLPVVEVAKSDLPPVIPSAGVTVSPATSSTSDSGVKEFSMNSWMETIDGKMSAHFSLSEIVVKKGDMVRIKIKNTKGTHDFVIDEFNVDKDTPEGEEVVVEFVADKVGDFEYYCSKYNHRSIGQKGTLRVTE